MTGRFNLLNRAQSIDADPSAAPYSRVTIYKGLDKENGDEATITVGDDSGRTLEITSDWGTQEQAERILAKIKGRRYQPFKATDTTLEPSAELGDAVSVGGVYSGIFSKITTLGGGIYSDISAPSPEEVEHELTHKTPVDRKYTRLVAEMRSEFRITEKEISARVEKTHGSDTENFWWSLQYDGWTVGSGPTKIFGVDKDGAFVNGTIRATAGIIGDFTLARGNLTTYGQTWDGDDGNGIFIGSEGIQCGPKSSGVQLTNKGNLYAENGYFRGTVRAGMIDYGGDDGYFSGSGLVDNSVSGGSGGKLDIYDAKDPAGHSPITGANLEGGINTSLGYADNFGAACGGSYIPQFYATTLYTQNLHAAGIVMQYGDNVYTFKPKYIYCLDKNGNAVQTLVLRL